MYHLITDGAYSSTNALGCAAFVILKDYKLVAQFSKSFENTTNNRMELSAIIMGFKSIKKQIDSLTIITDSMYCMGCGTLGWKRNSNNDLWKIFDKEYSRILSLCPDITWKHVKGHQKDDSVFSKWNNYVDKLAVYGTHKIKN